MSGGGNDDDVEIHEDHGDDELWLVSYSDLMTLLFGFFVLMYVFASAKAGDSEKVREGLAKAFGGSYTAQMEELAEDLKAAATGGDDDVDPVMSMVEIEQPKDGMEITFRSNLLFNSGSADLKPSVKRTLKMISGLIRKNMTEAELFVSGHTDDAPISTRRFPSNWELSGSRASSVVREFVNSGYDPKLLIALGHADTRPAYPNRDPSGIPIKENREKNRRVVIKVVSPGIVKAQTKPDGRPQGEGAPKTPTKE